MADAEAVDGVPVPVREQRSVQVEGLRPGHVRPRAVARDPEDLHARILELPAPVTQEQELVRSGARPVEEVEEQQVRRAFGQLAELNVVAGSEPDARRGNGVSDAGHHAVTVAASVASAISLATSTMSRFALKTRSWRSAPLPLARMSLMPSSSRAAPSSWACGAISLSVRRMSCAIGTRFLRPVERSITGASRP